MKREKISEILAKARIQASLDEPTRPTTPDIRNKIDYVPPLMHIATTKKLKYKSQMKSPQKESISLSGRSPLRKETKLNYHQQMRSDVLHLIESYSSPREFIAVDMELLENLAEVVDKYLKALKSDTEVMNEETFGEVWTEVTQFLTSYLDSCDEDIDVNLKNLACKIILKLSLEKLSQTISSMNRNNYSKSSVKDGATNVELYKVIFQAFYCIYDSSKTYTENSHNSNTLSSSSSSSSNLSLTDPTSLVSLHSNFDIITDFLNKLWSLFSADHFKKGILITAVNSIANDNNNNNNNTLNNNSSSGENTLSKQQSQQSNDVSPDIFDLLNIACTCLKNYSNHESCRKYLNHVSIIANLVRGARLCLNIIESCENCGKTSIMSGRSSSGDSYSNDSNNIQHNNSNYQYKNSSIQNDSLIKDKLNKCLVIIFNILRNFTLDSIKTLKSPLLSSELKLPTLLCQAGFICGSNTEMVLNCMRILAKLSLVESFRVELSGEEKNVGYLTNIIQNEADLCLYVIRGGTSNINSNNDKSNSSNISNSNSGGNNTNSNNCNNSKNNRNNEEKNDEDDVQIAEEWPSQYTWPLLSRLCFSMGNLTNSNAKNRQLIGVKYSCIEPLTVLLQTCVGALSQIIACNDNNNSTDTTSTTTTTSTSTTSATQTITSTTSTDSSEHEIWDATTKMLRLLLNLCINETVGYQAASSTDILQLLIDILDCSSSDKIIRTEQEELLLNAVAACTNLSYYINFDATIVVDDNISSDGLSQRSEIKDTVSSSVPLQQSKSTRLLQRKWILISQYLAQCLFSDNDEIVLESVKAYGNLSRHAFIAEPLVADGIIDIFLSLLSPTPTNSQSQSLAHTRQPYSSSHSEYSLEVINGIIGSFINMSIIPTIRQILLKNEVFYQTLVMKLRKTGFRYLDTSALLSQVFYNLSLATTRNGNHSSYDDKTDEKDSNSSISHSNELLKNTLLELIDCAEEYIQDNNTNSNNNNNNNNNRSSDTKSTYDDQKYNDVGDELGNTNNEIIQKYSGFLKIAKLLLTRL